MIASYAFTFCRLVIGIAFTWSSLGKLRDMRSFTAAIGRFGLLPKTLHRPVAWLFLIGELGVVVSMLLGSQLSLWGFLLAVMMLLVFCVALIFVLLRKVRISCNCFGASEKMVSPYDLIRNAGFIACALGGGSLYLARHGGLITLGWLDWGLASVVALIFVIIWVQAREIMVLFR